MLINSRIKTGSTLVSADQQTIKSEPMLHRATLNFAEDNGGPLTQRFISALPWLDAIIDSRVHMLMPGMYPCIPGWHHDDVPRERPDGQPNYESPSYKAGHCLALWGDCSLTEFAIGEHEVEIPPVGRKIYKDLNPIVERDIESGKLKRAIAPEATLVFFDWQAWHRGAPATHTGFRFFIRATRGSKLPPRNEIRANANVYMPILEEGW